MWPTPVITVEEEDEDMPTTILPGSRRTSSTSKPFLPLPGHEDDEPSSGVSDQGGNSDYDGESTFSPSPTGSFKGSNEYLGYRRSSSTLQSDDDYIDEDLTPSPTSPYRETKRNGSPTRMGNTLSPWSAVKKAVSAWSPFFQVYRKKYPWVQLAGHQGNFKPGGVQGTVLKKSTEHEQVALQVLMRDRMKPYVPEFKSIVSKEDGSYIEMQDLLRDFDRPAVMDIKMGSRTYLEEELVKAKSKGCLRKDMYEKMIAVDPNEPTEQEHNQKAITKPRYMQWREKLSSSATLGFRIEGIKMTGSEHPKKDYKTTRSQEEVCKCLSDFIGGNSVIKEKIHERLLEIRRGIEESEFFHTHEVIGSSLLFVYDDHGQANVWAIDFAKTTELPAGVTIDHRSKWEEGNHEDGYLFGLDNLILLWSSL